MKVLHFNIDFCGIDIHTQSEKCGIYDNILRLNRYAKQTDNLESKKS